MKLIQQGMFTFLGGVVFCAVVALLTIFLINIGHTKPTQETTITCTTNDSQLHALDGWKKIETVDYQRIGAQVEKGKAEVSCRTATLSCTAYIEGRAYPDIKGCVWYWRKNG